MYCAEVPATLAGIPCLLGVTHYVPGTPGRYSGPPEFCYPAEGPEVSFVVLDRRGRPAPWLERKADQAEWERLEELVVSHMESDCD